MENNDVQLQIVRRSSNRGDTTAVLEVRDAASSQIIVDVEMTHEMFGQLIHGLMIRATSRHGDLSRVGRKRERKTVSVTLSKPNARRVYDHRQRAEVAAEAGAALALHMNKQLKPSEAKWAFDGPTVSWSQDSVFTRDGKTCLRVHMVRYV